MFIPSPSGAWIGPTLPKPPVDDGFLVVGVVDDVDDVDALTPI